MKRNNSSNYDSDHSPKTQRQTTIPDDGWVIEINSYGEGAGYGSGKAWTIYRVPRNMFEISKNAFIPKLVSVGPFHYGDHCYKAMEGHKKRYLLRLLGYTDDSDGFAESQSSSDRKQHVGLGSLVSRMMDLEKTTRECYSETVHNNKSKSFVQMMVMDGCFIVELLRLHRNSISNKDVDDPVFTTRWMLCTLQRDLLMLENQLPFQVLEVLFDLTKLPGQESVHLVDLVLEFFNPLLPRGKEKLKVNPNDKYDHMLDVFRTGFLAAIPPAADRVEDLVTDKSSDLLNCATELQEAGLEFSKSQQPTDLLNIQFDRPSGTLNIPPLRMDDNTVPLFLNFMAYEQCDRDAQPYFSNHFMFLDRLVNTAKDIEVLHNNGVINHELGSDKDVAILINRLSREIIYDANSCHLREPMREINLYHNECAKKCHVWFKALKRDYFSSSWTLASLFAAIFLLVLTVCQTFFSAYAYFKPPN
ncbi:UPF0481 protein At3g47200-like isoform X1 [Papaver somniferum]|uniref:UPF0481 protein At3g47200-like isoform X1 n=1 Tax=Papaver somniferum TaxID=3469 RepID=UPI000E6FE5C6|nr:UPF0481 protein At3g47200-like isoform X1 [Papaver somniferum]